MVCVHCLVPCCSHQWCIWVLYHALWAALRQGELHQVADLHGHLLLGKSFHHTALKGEILRNTTTGQHELILLPFHEDNVMSSEEPQDLTCKMRSLKTRASRWFTAFCCLWLTLTPSASSPLFCQTLIGDEVSDQGRCVIWQNQFSWMDPSTVHSFLVYKLQLPEFNKAKAQLFSCSAWI